jgi:hypothetical protein
MVHCDGVAIPLDDARLLWAAMIRSTEEKTVKRATAVSCVFLDIGGVPLTNEWEHHARKRAATNFKLDGTVTTPFDILNELDRSHLAMDTIDRLPQTGEKGIYLKQQLKDKLIEHKQYIDKNGQDMPEIRNWKWKG